MTDRPHADDLSPTGTAQPTVDLPRLPLPELRDYRARLREEEDRVSYWRRLVHARIDLLRAGRDASTLGLEQVVRALGDTGTGQRREALHRVRAFDPLPELPVLAEVWDAPGAGPGGSGDPAAVEAQVSRLAAAAAQLSTYRTALHARIDAATAELIARYRRDPALALRVLPAAGPQGG